MSNFRWAGSDGAELVARPGALVASNWTFIQVPLGAVALDAETLTEKRVIEGDGWRLTLPAEWRVTRTSGRVEVRPPASPR